MRPMLSLCPLPRSRGRSILLTVLLVSLLLLSACAAPAPRFEDVGEGLPIPEFQLSSLDGDMVRSTDLAGQPVVLNFWATWCGPCVREIPTLRKLHRADGVKVVSIALDEQGASVVRPFVERHAIDYPVLLGDHAVFQRFNGSAIPYTFVLDADLQVVEVHRGLVSARRLEKDLRRAMGS